VGRGYRFPTPYHLGAYDTLYFMVEIVDETLPVIENQDICLPLVPTPLLGGPCRNIVITFGKEKLEWCAYPMVK